LHNDWELVQRRQQYSIEWCISRWRQIIIGKVFTGTQSYDFQCTFRFIEIRWWQSVYGLCRSDIRLYLDVEFPISLQNLMDLESELIFGEYIWNIQCFIGEFYSSDWNYLWTRFSGFLHCLHDGGTSDPKHSICSLLFQNKEVHINVAINSTKKYSTTICDGIVSSYYWCTDHCDLMLLRWWWIASELLFQWSGVLERVPFDPWNQQCIHYHCFCDHFISSGSDLLRDQDDYWEQTS